MNFWTERCAAEAQYFFGESKVLEAIQKMEEDKVVVWPSEVVLQRGASNLAMLRQLRVEVVSVGEWCEFRR